MNHKINTSFDNTTLYNGQYSLLVTVKFPFFLVGYKVLIQDGSSNIDMIACLKGIDYKALTLTE